MLRKCQGSHAVPKEKVKQLFWGAKQCQACIEFWVFRHDRINRPDLIDTLRDRWWEALLFEADNMGVLSQCIRKQKQLSLDKIGGTYHSRRGELEDDAYAGAPSCCRAIRGYEIEVNLEVLV